MKIAIVDMGLDTNDASDIRNETYANYRARW